MRLHHSACRLGLLASAATFLFAHAGRAQHGLSFEEVGTRYDLVRSEASHAGPSTQAEFAEALHPLVESGAVYDIVYGRSAEKRPLTVIVLAGGPIEVLFWSQAHGDARLATHALVDLISFLANHPTDPLAASLREQLTIVAFPMVNPDGGEHATRRNAQGIDVLLDARRLATPEGATLAKLNGHYDFSYAFALEAAAIEATGAPAVVLSVPSIPDAGDLEVRGRAIAAAGALAGALRVGLGGRVVREEAPFDSRSFPDIVQEKGASTVRVGLNGTDKSAADEVRRATFVALLSALHALVADSAQLPQVAQHYSDLPLAERAAGPSEVDLLIRGASLRVRGLPHARADVAVAYGDPRAGTGPRIIDIGDLTATAAHTISERGLSVHVAAAALEPTSPDRSRLVLEAPAIFEVVRRTPTMRAKIYTIAEGQLERTPDYRFPRRPRWFVSIQPTQLASGSAAHAENVETALHEVGWNDPLAAGVPHSESRGTDVRLSTGYTFFRSFAIELHGGRIPEWRTRGARMSGAVEVIQSAQYAAALLSYEFRYLRVGAGPARLNGKWTWHESAFGEPTAKESGSSASSGFAFDVGLALPAGTRVAPELRFQKLTFGDRMIDGFADIPAFPLRNRSTSIGVAVVVRR